MGPADFLTHTSVTSTQEPFIFAGCIPMKIKLLTILLLSWQSLCPQPLYKVTADYFRQDPFKVSFSQFLNNLMSDPALTEQGIRKKNDSTLFYMQGIYTAHSPFFFPAVRSKVIIAEQQEFTDTSQTEVYTHFVYQLIGYAPPGKEGLKDIREEFERLNRRLKKGLSQSDRKELKRGSEDSGAIINYTYRDMIFYPLTIAWASSPGNKENIIAISVRFFVEDNRAYLPIPAYSP
jgi:hypothetical protein